MLLLKILVSSHFIVCVKSTVMCAVFCVCCSVFKSVELNFPFTHNGIISFISYIFQGSPTFWVYKSIIQVWSSSKCHHITDVFARIEELIKRQSVKTNGSSFENNPLITFYNLCKKYSDVCCECCSVFKSVELYFQFTKNGINSFPSYIFILLASRISCGNKVVCTVKHMFSLILFLHSYFMTFVKRGQGCVECVMRLWWQEISISKVYICVIYNLFCLPQLICWTYM
jgi:hypothetical protein